MNVICIQDQAFYALIEEVVDRMKEKSGQVEDRWVKADDAMELLGIKSKTTLQKLRDEGKIRFSQPYKKVILYDRESILQLLENNAKETF
ncbi:MAG: helix-turn-helix domain-containing protein [Flavobacteriales bacterium]|nr:helix-turn-helix domain-containing protein [Flavobacteriales bacterium]